MAIPITAKGAIPRRRLLYIALSALMALIVAAGFWPTYFGPLVRLTLAQPPLIHVHAVVFTGWLALFSAQAVFAATGRLRWHLRLGRVGIAYGVLLVTMGLTTGVLRPAALPRGGQAEGLLYVAVVDMLVAAVGRNPDLPAPLPGLAGMFLVWSSPVLLAVASDWRHNGGGHPVYVAGLAVFAFRMWSEPLALTSAWTGDGVLMPFTQLMTRRSLRR